MTMRCDCGCEFEPEKARLRHRVMCGDSTDAGDVAMLLAGAEPYLMVTDPPYGVALDQGWRDRIGINLMGKAQSDALQGDEGFNWASTIPLWPTSVVYLWHGGAHSVPSFTALEDAGYEVRQQIVWVKTMAPLSRSAYHWKHEPCWYAVRHGADARWAGDRKQTTVWELASPKHIMGGSDEEKQDHPTQKPLGCMSLPIHNHKGDVCDPFLGSGTTIIAAEQEGRVCYGMEIEPKYVAVTLERCQKYGMEPVKT
jgi:DNA modification methylase